MGSSREGVNGLPRAPARGENSCVRRRRRRALDLREVYRRLRARRGPAGWWPAQTPFEVCLGAILVQNTAWPNVEKALAVLRAHGLVSYESLQDMPPSALAPLIRPSGCFNVKARRVRAFLDFLGREYEGRVERMAAADPWTLRAQLLAVPGIGPETADSIALYAAGRPLFVVDAYTRRVFARLGPTTSSSASSWTRSPRTRPSTTTTTRRSCCWPRRSAGRVPRAGHAPWTTSVRPPRARRPAPRRAKMRTVLGASRFRREQRPRAMQAERATGS